MSIGWHILIAGIAGTAIMTAYVAAMARLLGFHLDVHAILGSLITFRTRPSGKVSRHWSALLAGYLGHYFIGYIFSVVYIYLWQRGIGKPTLPHILDFGAVSAVVALLFWSISLKLHPLTPAINRKLFLLLISTGHFVFAAGDILYWIIILKTQPNLVI